MGKKKKLMVKNGFTTIEVVIGSLIFLLVFICICDFLVISNRYLMLTDTTKEMARTISVQGGSLKTKEASYAGNYYNIEQLSKIFQKQMNGMGFHDDEYALYITYTKIFDDESNESKEVTLEEEILGKTAGGTYGVIKPTQKIDYLSDFKVTVKAVYTWPFTRSVFKLKPTMITISMPGLSEWRYSYDGWESE